VVCRRLAAWTCECDCAGRRAGREPATDPGGSAGALRSGIYTGRVVHHRYTPVDHRFTYRIALVYLDLSEIAAVCRLHPLWSREAATPSPSAVRLPRRPLRALDDAVRDLVEERTAPVHRAGRVLTSCARGLVVQSDHDLLLLDPTHTEVETVVVEVTNTRGTSGRPTCCPAPGSTGGEGMHVSPFLPMA